MTGSARRRPLSITVLGGVWVFSAAALAVKLLQGRGVEEAFFNLPLSREAGLGISIVQVFLAGAIGIGLWQLNEQARKCAVLLLLIQFGQLVLGCIVDPARWDVKLNVAAIYSCFIGAQLFYLIHRRAAFQR